MRTFAMAIVLLLASRLAAVEIKDGDACIAVRGDTYRLTFSKSSGVFDIEVQSADGALESIVRKGGEKPWYGCNSPAGELSTAGHRPTLSLSKHGEIALLTSTCRIDPASGLTHHAVYAFFDKWGAVSSSLTAEKAIEGLGIVRVAPRLDVDVDALAYYACRDGLGQRRSGTMADLGERDAYLGLSPWGRRGVLCKGFEPGRAYLALYDPRKARSVAFAYPFFDEMWKDKHIFLQLHISNCNYWYAGFGGASVMGQDFLFCIRLDSVRDPDAIERELPGMFRTVEQLVSAKVLPARSIWARREAETKLAALRRDLESIWAKEKDVPPTTDDARRAAWLSRCLWRESARCFELGKSQEAVALAERALSHARRLNP